MREGRLPSDERFFGSYIAYAQSPSNPLPEHGPYQRDTGRAAVRGSETVD
jgi:hypothetical protein